MSYDSGTQREEVELFVSDAPFAQTIGCPACGEEFDELVTEGISGVNCPECNASIQFTRERDSGRERVETEQVTLTDGGQPFDSGTQQDYGVPCTECEHGRVVVSDAIYAECDNCDAAFERNEVGL